MADAVPKNGEYLDGKLWFQRKGTVVTIGLNNVALDELGALESIDLPDEGDDFVKGDVVATVGGAKGSLEITAPAAGVIEEINAAAKDDPERVTEDPLEEGWLVKINVQDTSELKEYFEL